MRRVSLLAALAALTAVAAAPRAAAPPADRIFVNGRIWTADPRHPRAAGGWQPHERISAEAALRHFTRDAAFASFEEQRTGTLSAGMLADLVVLSDDIVASPPERILKTRVLLTVMGGRDTYRSGEF